MAKQQRRGHDAALTDKQILLVRWIFFLLGKDDKY